MRVYAVERPISARSFETVSVWIDERNALEDCKRETENISRVFPLIPCRVKKYSGRLASMLLAAYPYTRK